MFALPMRGAESWSVCGMMGYIFIFLLVILLETVVPCVHLRT